MHVSRHRAAEQALQQDLPRRRGEQIRAAHHVGDALLEVIHHDGELVGEQAVGAPHDEIADFAGEVLLDPALEGVVECDHPIVHPHADRARLAPRRKPAAAGAGIDRLARKRKGRIGDLPPRAGAAEHRLLAFQTRQRLAVGCAATALEHDLPVPFEAVRLERPENRPGGSGCFARRVQVLHAHEPLAAARARIETAADRRNERTEMQRPGGRGREAPAIGFCRVMHNRQRNHISAPAASSFKLS